MESSCNKANRNSGNSSIPPPKATIRETQKSYPLAGTESLNQCPLSIPKDSTQQSRRRRLTTETVTEKLRPIEMSTKT